MQLSKILMNSKPLISLITVCFNAEQLIEQTLKSAMDQTFQDFELVIIDGGSKDKTVSIASNFASKTGTLISEPDKGIYDAMNKGLKASKGEWVYFLNAGDSFYDNYVLADLFENKNYSGIDLIYAKVQTKNEPTGINYLNGKHVKFSDFYSHYPICHQATFARKNLFEKVGVFDLKYPLVADSEWFIRIFKNPEINPLFIDKVVAFYDIQGATYHKRMKGYREYLAVGYRHFPLWVAIINSLMYPMIWAKVKIIRTFQNTVWFKKYRELKFKNKLANE